MVDGLRGNKEGRKKCVEALVKAGADTEIRDTRGKKPWMLSQQDDVRAVSHAPTFITILVSVLSTRHLSISLHTLFFSSWELVPTILNPKP